MKKVTFIFSLLILVAIISCQITINGHITDKKTTAPIQGANVTTTAVSATTDSKGGYTFKVPKSALNKSNVEASMSGYHNQSKGLSGTSIDFQLESIGPPPPPPDYTAQLTQLICTGQKPQMEGSSQTKLHEENKNEADAAGVFVPCKYETWKKVDKYEDIISLNPLNDIIWTGSVVQGKNLIQGMPSSINLPRNPTTITLTGLNFNDNRPNSIEINNPSKATIDEGVRQILQGRTPVSTTGQISYNVKQVYSYEHALMSLGLSANWNWGQFSAQLSSKNYQTRNTFVVKLVQNYYSISCPSPSAAGSVFQKNTLPSQLSPYISSENPPCLITNVNYGRIFLLSFTSAESESKVQAALNASFSNWGVNGKVDFSYDAQRILNESEISIFAIGGSSQKIAEVITGVSGKPQADVLKDYILQGANFSLASAGAPIGYKAVFLCDNSQAAVNSTTEYKIRTCSTISYKKPFTLQMKEWVMRDVTDDDEDMNFGYKITFYDQRGTLIGREYSNNRGSTYVEEPSKVGLKNDKNRFFYNEPPITISDPAVFKIIVEIRVNTEDGDCDRPWRRNPNWSQEIDVASLVAGEYRLSPWDSMDFVFTHN